MAWKMKLKKKNYDCGVTYGTNSEATVYSCSLDPASAFYVTKVFGEDPQTVEKPLYVYKHFEAFNTKGVAAVPTSAQIFATTTLAGDTNYVTGSGTAVLSASAGLDLLMGKMKEDKSFGFDFDQLAKYTDIDNDIMIV